MSSFSYLLLLVTQDTLTNSDKSSLTLTSQSDSAWLCCSSACIHPVPPSQPQARLAHWLVFLFPEVHPHSGQTHLQTVALFDPAGRVLHSTRWLPLHVELSPGPWSLADKSPTGLALLLHPSPPPVPIQAAAPPCQALGPARTSALWVWVASVTRLSLDSGVGCVCLLACDLAYTVPCVSCPARSPPPAVLLSVTLFCFLVYLLQEALNAGRREASECGLSPCS